MTCLVIEETQIVVHTGDEPDLVADLLHAHVWPSKTALGLTFRRPSQMRPQRATVMVRSWEGEAIRLVRDRGAVTFDRTRRDISSERSAWPLGECTLGGRRRLACLSHGGHSPHIGRPFTRLMFGRDAIATHREYETG